MDITSYGVNYKASKLQLHGGDGAKDAISHIKSTLSSCPDTKIVLGGYSQGASVINIVAATRWATSSGATRSRLNTRATSWRSPPSATWAPAPSNR